MAKSLHGVAKRIRVLELPGLPPKGDVINWEKAGYTREEFLALAHKAREWTPHVDDEPPTAPNDSDGSSNPPSKFKLINIDDIEVEDEPVRLIENLMPAGPGLLVFAGPPKTLKSFVLMYALLHVAAGLEYAGCKVQQGAVVYVTSEGVRGVKRRLVAMRKHLGIHGKRVPFYLVSVMPNLGAGSDDAKALIAAIKSVVAPEGVPVRAVAIDTLRRANPGKDENNTKDMSMFIDNCGAIADSFRCLTAAPFTTRPDRLPTAVPERTPSMRPWTASGPRSARTIAPV